MTENNTPQKSYYVQLPGYEKGEVWDEAKYMRNRERLFNEHSDAIVMEQEPYDTAGLSQPSNPDDSYSVHLQGYEDGEVWDAAKFDRNKERLFKEHPDVSVSRVVVDDYWGDKLGELNKKIDQNESSLSLKQQELDLGTGDKKLLKTQKKQYEDTLDTLYREREKNYAWQRAKKAQQDYLSSERDRIAELYKSAPSGAVVQSSAGAFSQQSKEQQTLSAAQMYYEDALKKAQAPSRYDDDKTGFGNFFRGAVGNIGEVITLKSLVEAGANMNLVGAIEKIQANEGKNCNLFALMDDPKKADYLTPEEHELVKAFCVKSAVDAQRSKDLSLGYQAGEGAIASVGFMADFFATGAIGGSVAKLATKGITKGIAKTSAKLGLKGMGREAALAVPKFVEGTIGAAAKSLVMTPLMPSSYSNLVDNLLQINDAGSVDLSGKAFIKSIGDVFIENMSENAGVQVEAILGIPLKALKAGGGALLASQSYDKIMKVLRLSSVGKILKEAGWNGFIGEIGEEWWGNAVRVLTKVDPDALKNFATVDQQLITLASFAPMSIFGGTASMGQYTASKMQYDKAAEYLSKTLASNGYGEDQIKDILDVSKCESPQDMAALLAPVITQIASDNQDRNGKPTEVAKAVFAYANALARYKCFDSMLKADASDARENMRSTIDERFKAMGQDAWHTTTQSQDAAGNPISVDRVRIIRDNESGTDYYIIGEAEQGFAAVGTDGKMKVFSPEQVAQMSAEPSRYSDTGYMSMDDYLDKMIAAKKKSDEKVRMQQETQQQTTDVASRLPVGEKVNIGTVENPVEGTVVQSIPEGVIIQGQDGQFRQYTWSEAAGLVGKKIEVLTDDEKDRKAADAIVSREQRRAALNRHKGVVITKEGKQYELMTTVVGQDEQGDTYRVLATDESGNYVRLELTQEEVDAILKEEAVKEESHDDIGTQSVEKSIAIIEQMRQGAEQAPNIELTPENYEQEFGPDKKLNTPIGEVKIGENQYSKLVDNGRESQFALIKPTLTNPDVILEETSPEEGAERQSKYLFVKTFIKADGTKYIHFQAVTVKKDGLEVNISSHRLRDEQVLEKLQKGKMLWSRFDNGSDASGERQGLDVQGTETPNSTEHGSTPQGISPDKGTQSSENKDNVFTDFRGNEIPVRTNKKGLKVIDKEAFWNTDPEAYLRYNDAHPSEINPNSSAEVLDANISGLSKDLEKLNKEYKQKSLKISNSDDIEDLEDEVRQKQQRLDQLQAIKAQFQKEELDAREQQSQERRALNEQAKAQAQQAQAQQEQQTIEQQESISGVPDYYGGDTAKKARIRGFRRLGPEKIDRQEPLRPEVGKAIAIKFNDANKPKGNAVVVDVSSLQPSHVNRDRNPKFFIDEAQPKDRVDEASLIAAHNIASHINPAEITGSILAHTGAPVVNARGEAIQGNNRAFALMLMYGQYPKSAAKYRQYLIDHSDEFGLTKEQIENVERPVLVNMIDVSDEQAIMLGQIPPDDNSSGDIQGIKETLFHKMGKDFGYFAELLLSSEDDGLSLRERVRANAITVLRWLHNKKYITDTQHQSAFNRETKLLTEKAVEDLENVVKQVLFDDGNTALNALFGKLPAKAQSAILSTIWRDLSSPYQDRLIEEVRRSIIAFCELINQEDFANAKNAADALVAANVWSAQLTWETDLQSTYVPSERYGTLAIHLAALYKGYTMKQMRQIFNDIYDHVQGQTDLFGGEAKPMSLSEAVKTVLNIDYEPRQSQNDEAPRVSVDSDTSPSPAGGQGGTLAAPSGEQVQSGEQPADSGAGTSGNGRGGETGERTSLQGQANLDKGEGENRVGSQGEAESSLSDAQGNPIDADGKLITENVGSIDELTDADFTEPTRSVELPELPRVVQEALGTNGKPVVIKKNIFAKNRDGHKDVAPSDSRVILSTALYQADIYGQNQKSSRPYNWILVHLADKHTSVIIELNKGKDNIEIVNWHYLNDKTLEQKKNQAAKEGGLLLTLSKDNAAGNTVVNGNLAQSKQAEREDGQPLILPSASAKEAGALSGPTQDVVSADKGTESSEKNLLDEAIYEKERQRIYAEYKKRLASEEELSAAMKWFDDESDKLSAKYHKQIEARVELIEAALTAPKKVKLSAGDWVKNLLVKGARTSKINLFDFVCKDDIHFESFKGIFHHKGVCVATNTQILIAVRADYDKSLEGKSIDKDGKELTFSDHITKWSQLIPNPSISSVKVDLHKLADAVNAAIAKQKEQKANKQEVTKSFAFLLGGQPVLLELDKLKPLVKALKNIDNAEAYINVVPREKYNKYTLVVKGDGVVYMTILQAAEAVNEDDTYNDVALAQSSEGEQRYASEEETRKRSDDDNSKAKYSAPVQAALDEAERLGIDVVVYNSEAEVPDEVLRQAGGSMKYVKAWYGTETGTVGIYAPNCTSKEDALQSVWHEVVAHKGLRALLGDEQFDKLCLDVYKSMDASSRQAEARSAFREMPRKELRRLFGDEIPRSFDAMNVLELAKFLSDEYVQRYIADEYMASSAESGEFSESVWEKIVAAFRNFVRTLGMDLNFTDADIKDLLRRSYERLKDNSENEERAKMDNVRFRMSEEEKGIVLKAVADGTFMKAPNGKKSNLTERQWLQVRTKAFKDWFGDWEKANELRLLDNVEAISLDGIKPANQKEAEEIITNLAIGQNKYDGRKTQWNKNVVGKIMRHKGFDASLLIPKLKDIYDNSVRILSESEVIKEGHKVHTNFSGYHHYVGKITLNGREYYVRMTLQELRTRSEDVIPNQLHSTYVSDVEIFSADNRVNSGNGPATMTASTKVDAKLRDFFEQARKAESECSKVVDENGEPLVVYHGTRKSGFSVFDDAAAGIKQSHAPYGTAWFSSSKFVAQSYSRDDNTPMYEQDENGDVDAGAAIYECFLNIRDPYIEDFYGSGWDGSMDGKVAVMLFDRNGDFAEYAYGDDGTPYFENRAVAQMWVAYNGLYDGEYEIVEASLGTDTNNVVEEALEYGVNDGVIIYNVVDFGQYNYGEEANDYIVFKPEQIKSATDNTGAFDAANPDIRFRNGDEHIAPFIDNATLLERKKQVLQLFHKAASGEFTGKSVPIGTLTDKGRDFLSQLSGKQMKGSISFALNPSDLRHIYNDHYKANEKDLGNNYPLSDDDIMNLVDVIALPERVIPIDEDGVTKFIFLRESPQGGAYNLVEVYTDRRGNLTAKSLYNTKKGVSQRVMTIVEQSKLSTSETTGATLSQTNIPLLFDLRDEKAASAEANNGEEENVLDDRDVLFRRIEDKAKIEELESGDKVKVYRAMQVIGGKLYPPMSAMVDGKMREAEELGVWEQSEERPDLVDEKGNFILKKGGKGANGKQTSSVPAKYNPYFHSSRTPLNDQFSAAYLRPNLVTVECEVPQSELSSGYKAEKAKDAVGEIMWHSGPVSGKLPKGKERKVILSRYLKPVRIVSDAEVASIVSDMLKEENIQVPANCVTSSLRSELEKRGVDVYDTEDTRKALDDENYRLNVSYMQALARGDMEEAQRLVNEAAERNGYSDDTSYMGHWFNGSAPYRNGYFDTRDERVEAFLNGEGEGTHTLGDFAEFGVDWGNVEEELYGRTYLYHIRRGDTDYTEAADNLRRAVEKVRSGEKNVKIKMYRAVDASIKEGSFRNGDWITPSRIYAKKHASIQSWENSRIIEQEVSIDDIWYDGNDIREWGYDDEKEYSYKNTKNNRKLLDVVTYDDDGSIIPLSDRFNQKKGDVRFRLSGEQDLQRVNDEFNKELQEQIDGKQEKGHIYKLGMPGEVLLSTGIPMLPIELSATHLLDKSKQENHPFDIADVRDLPKALETPIAIFEYGNASKSQNIIVALEHNGKKFLVGLHLNQHRDGLDVNSIRGLFPKDASEWLNWVSDGKARYLNKEEIQDLIRQQRINLADVPYLDLDNITKVVENFENPKLGREDNVRFRFIGENGAANADRAEEGNYRLDNLETARAMEKAGKDAKTVKYATGWERGADGKWRYEEEDVKISRLHFLNRDGQHEIPLKQFLVNDRSSERLFAAYPRLLGTRVMLADYGYDYVGAYNKVNDTLLLNSKMLLDENGDIRESAMDVVCHELQHAIQEIEGFSRGGNSDVAKKYKDERLSATYNGYDAHKYRAQADWNEYDNLSKMSPNEIYRHFAGEVEARNVENRMQMSAEERRRSLASETEDVSREDQLFFYGINSGDEASISGEQDLQRVNDAFNKELQEQIDGKQEKGHIYKLGMPGDILLSAGLRNLPIELSAERLAIKSSEEYRNKHPFSLASVKDLPKAINEPIAVFKSATRQDTKVVLTELQYNGSNFVVAISMRKNDKYRKLDVEVNDIRSLYPKDRKNTILDWINNGLLTWVDKDKIKDFLSTQWPNALEAEKKSVQRPLSRANGPTPLQSEKATSAAKVIENFNNPKLGREDNVRFRISDSRKEQMRSGLRTKLTDMSEEEIETNIALIEKLGEDNRKRTKDEGNPKLEKAAYHWLEQGAIRLPEDDYKVLDAISVAEKKGVDPLRYKSPMELLNAFPTTKPSQRKTDPDTIEQFSDKRELPKGVVTYEVEDSREGQAAVRRMIDEHFGADANPWCLAARLDGNLDKAWEYWNHYNAYPKRIVFQNGRLLAFCANDSKEVTYWDRTDIPYSGIPIVTKEVIDGIVANVRYEMTIDGDLGNPLKIWSGDAENGVYREWYNNRQLQGESNYKNGKREGLYRLWYENGQIRIEENYKNGNLDGLYREWYRDGTFKYKLNYKDGYLDGLCRSWRENGQPRIESNRRGGQLDGVYREWDEDGQPILEMKYKDGKADGLFLWWLDNGRLLSGYNFEGREVSKEEYERLSAERDGNIRFRFGDAYDYEKYPEGRVEPGLSKKEVNVVNIPRHDFAGTGKQAIEKAKVWAKEHIVNESKEPYITKEGLKYTIDEDAIGKMLSGSSTTHSENLGVHLAVLKQLPTVINESILVETHPDFVKKNNDRMSSNGIGSKNLLVYRLYGAVEMDGTTYRTKTTLREKFGQGNTAYDYKVTEVELAISGSEANDALANKTSVTGANLLKDVEMSYKKGVKVLEESEKMENVRFGKLFRSITNASPADYSASLQGRNEAAQSIAESLGVEVEVVSREKMPSGHESAYGYWEDGRIYVCTPNCADMEQVAKTVIHEAVGHLGLRRLVGEENMHEFCSAILDALPTGAKEQVVRSALYSHGGNFDEAVEEYLARLSEDMDFSNKASGVWTAVKAAFRELFRKLGIKLKLSDNDLRYILWQSYYSNKGGDLLLEARRAALAHSLGFSMTDRRNDAKADEQLRFRQADDTLSAARLYNNAVADAWTRLHEVYVDMNSSINTLVDALEKSSGKKAQAFEDVRLSLNHQSSKGLAEIENWENKYWRPLVGTIKSLIKDAGVSLSDVERYVMLKHGLERNEVLAKRDARSIYQAEYNKAVSQIRDNADLSSTQKAAETAKAKATLDGHLSKIDNGTDVHYLEFRKKDYGGLTSLYSDFDDIEPKGADESEEEYSARVLKARHPKYPDIAKTEAAAAEEVRQLEALFGAERVKELWERTNAATKATLEHQYKANMLSRKQYDAVCAMFKYYIPLRGFKDTQAQDLYSYYASEKGGFDAALLVAKGRKTEAESPFGHIGSMASSAVAADVKNETKLSLYYFVCNRPDNDLVTISEVWYEKDGTDPETGRTRFKPVYPPFNDELSSEQAKKELASWEEQMRQKAASGLAFKGRGSLDLHNSVIHIDEKQKNSHVIAFKVGGKEMAMYICGNPRAAQALNNELNVEVSNGYQRYFGSILRWFSGINTSYNPEFWLSNAQRDALFALMSVSVKEDGEYGRAFRRNYLRLLGRLIPGRKGVGKLMSKRRSDTLGDSGLDRFYKEFVDNGGVTGYVTLKDNEQWENEMRVAAEGLESGVRKSLSAVRTAFEKIADVGESIEQTTRFAAYITSRQMGKGVKESIADAKELTVNFNRKGSGKAVSWEETEKLRDRKGRKLDTLARVAVMGASWLPAYGRRFIMFFNASVQGLNAMFKLAKRNPAKLSLWAGGFLVLGVMNAVLHALLDDDDDYLDIPDYERRNNLLIGGNGVYFKWALPQESRVFYAIGDMAVNHIMGREPHKSMLSEIAQTLGDIAPLNASGGLSAVAPSAVAPLVEVYTNEDYKGAKIYRDFGFLSDEEQKRTPAYTRAFKSTGRVYVDISKALNELSGGDNTTAGKLNINPASVEHLVQGAIGGAGTAGGKLYRSTLGQFFGEDLSVRNTPFLSRLLTLNDERSRNAHIADLYEYYKAEAEHTKKRFNQYVKEGNSDKIEELEKSGDLSLMHIYEGFRKALKSYDERIAQTVDPDERKKLIGEQDEYRKMMIDEISKIK